MAKLHWFDKKEHHVYEKRPYETKVPNTNIRITTDLKKFYIIAQVIDGNQRFEENWNWSQSCDIRWRGFIQRAMFKTYKKNFEAWKAVYTRISPFFSLYSGSLNFSTYVIIAHQNYVSLFDLREYRSKRRLCATLDVGDLINYMGKVDMNQDNLL